MSKYEHKDNTASLFINNKTKDSQPDYTGSGKINGKFMYLKGWKNTYNDINGNQKSRMSIKFEPPNDTAIKVDPKTLAVEVDMPDF